MSASLLEEVRGFLRRFVVMSDAQLDAVTLWAAHTHAIDAADATPYLHASSAEPRSGKTRLLEVLELLVHEPVATVNISDAALFRVVQEQRPTLLFDEVDAIFGPKANGNREDLRGMLNAGYRRGATVRRMGGAKMTQLETFSVFCPKALAGIGALPGTIADRTIAIRLLRRVREERVERFRRRLAAPEGHELRDRLADWLEPQLEELERAEPVLPDALDDRAQDCWEPLFAIADLAGGAWPARTRLAALALADERAEESASLGVRLLADLHAVFEESGETRLRTADLLERLCRVEESPWGDWYGKTLSAQALSKLLQPYRIKTMTIKVEGEPVRGYKREQFEDAWARQTGVTRVTGVTTEFTSHAEGNAGNAGNAQNQSAGATGEIELLEEVEQLVGEGVLRRIA